jgi:hypothetical protein
MNWLASRRKSGYHCEGPKHCALRMRCKHNPKDGHLRKRREQEFHGYNSHLGASQALVRFLD